MSRRQFLLSTTAAAASLVFGGGNGCKRDVKVIYVKAGIESQPEQKENDSKTQFTTFIKKNIEGNGLETKAAIRCISPYFLPVQVTDSELSLSLLGPMTIGPLSEAPRKKYDKMPYFTEKDLQGEKEGSWADIQDYLRDDLTDEQLIELVVNNMKLLTSVSLDREKIDIIRDGNNKIRDVKYHGKNQEYTIGVYRKKEGRWAVYDRTYRIFGIKNHLILPPKAGGTIKIPTNMLREDPNVTVHLDVNGEKKVT